MLPAEVESQRSQTENEKIDGTGKVFDCAFFDYEIDLEDDEEIARKEFRTNLMMIGD